MRIAIVGASGFVGTAVAERLLARDNAEVVMLIHSSGNAWRLARRGVDLNQCNLLDRYTLAHALRACTHVINCTRGAQDVMLTGLQNLLHESRAIGVKKFVHLSSVAVYGDPPPPESVGEDAPTLPRKGTYGALKLAQDVMVTKAVRAGLPAVIICPSNISGPYSYFLLAVLAGIRDGTLALADNGDAPCVLVDVNNLAYAIDLALDASVADGRRLFITDDEPTNWRDVVDALHPLAGSNVAIQSIAIEDLAQRYSRLGVGRKPTLVRSITHPFSGEVREALRRDPRWERLDTYARGAVSKLGSRVEAWFRRTVSGPTSVPKFAVGPRINLQLSSQQLRGVRHSCDAAKRVLNYHPIYSFDASMQAFSRWYRETHGLDGEFADLLSQLA